MAYLILFLLSLLTGCTHQQGDPEVVDRTFMHQYGVEVPLEDWKNRGANGQIISRLKNGVVVSKNYRKGVQEAETTYTFPYSDAIECRETYSQGKLDKKVSFYFYGIPREEIQYRPGGEKVTVWYESGSPKSIEEYEGGAIVNGEYYNVLNAIESTIENSSGLRINRDEYGELISTEIIAGGKVQERTSYYANGTPKEITPFVNEIVEGERKTFLPAGEPSTLEYWQGGVQNGTTYIFQNGDKYAEVPYVKGVKNGIEKRYRNGRTIVEEIAWCDNTRHGPSYTYIGDSVKTEYYFQGKEVSKNQYDILMKLENK